MGTQLAEGGARLQTIMAVLGHKSTAMAMIYTRISDPEVRRQYEAALTAGQRITRPAAEALLRGEMSEEAVHWLQTNFLKTELELGHCLRLPAEGPCECDLALTCPNFLTTSEYTPDSEPDSTARTSSSPTPNSAGGSGKSSDTKPPNDAWSSCSTTWSDAYWVCPFVCGCRSQAVCTSFQCLNGGAGSRWVPLQHPAQRPRQAVTSQAAEPSRTPSGVSCAANSARRFAAAAARCASSAPNRSQADWPSCHLVP